MNLCPQILIRFGATFPETTVGRGKEKTVVKDYKNLVYNLDAYESFNKNLIKGIAKEHINPLKDAENIKVKVAEITKIDKDNCETRFTWEDALGKLHCCVLYPLFVFGLCGSFSSMLEFLFPKFMKTSETLS